MEQPLITIIIPVYKVEAYLDRCVQSVVDQTYKNLEIILVDDGSPDNCPAMCDAWAKKDARIRVIHQNNGGLSAARNAGIDAATGDYLMFVDSDDTIHPDGIQVLLDAAISTEADISVGRCVCVRAGSDHPATQLPKINPVTIRGIDAIARQYAQDEPWQYVSACWKLYRRKLFNEFRFPVGRLFEDEFTTYLLYDAANHVADLPGAVIYYYLENEAGITGNLTLQKYFDEYDAQRERINYFRKKQYEELLDLSLQHFLHTAQWHMLACEKPHEDLDELRRLRFRQQYRDALREAEARGLVSFRENYDYYVIAYPDKKPLFLVKKVISRLSKNTKPHSSDKTNPNHTPNADSTHQYLQNASDSSATKTIPTGGSVKVQFSVIIPVYNRAAILPLVIESVRAQTFFEFELIIVDDGSTDETSVIADNYAAEDSRIRVIHQANGGVCKARNAGLDAANGEYIVFLDSDNTMKPNMLERINAAIVEVPDLVVFGFDTFTPDRDETLDEETIRKQVIPEHINIRQRNRFFFTNFIWNKCYRRAFLDANGIRFDPERRTWEDGRFTVDCLSRAASLRLLPENIYTAKCSTPVEHLSDRVFENQLAKYLEDETVYRQRFNRDCDFTTDHYIRNNTSVFHLLVSKTVHAFPKQALSLITDALQQAIVLDWFTAMVPSNRQETHFRNAVLDGNTAKVIQCIKRENNLIAKVQQHASLLIKKNK